MVSLVSSRFTTSNHYAPAGGRPYEQCDMASHYNVTACTQLDYKRRCKYRITARLVHPFLLLRLIHIVGLLMGVVLRLQENVASTSGRIEINARTINATTNARRSTVAHEIGHLLWLSDNPAVSNDNNSLMAGGRNRETVFTPQPYDIQNVLFRYN